MAVGLMDVIVFPNLKKSYRVLLDKKGKLIAVESSESAHLTKIVSKKIIAGAKTQLKLLDGGCVLVDKDAYKTGDSVVVQDKKVKSHFSIAAGAPILLTGGKHTGDFGTVEDIVGNKILYKNDANEIIETSKEFAFVTGDKKPLITIK